MLFANYGLFWHVERVKWGKPGHAGTLSGFRTNKEGEVDFREQRGVYALYDESFQILYVGQAGYGNQRLYQRLHQHRFDALGERWARFSWFGIDPVKGKAGHKEVCEREPDTPAVSAVLNHLEAILIAAAEPALNRQGGKFGKAQQFYQWYEQSDDEVGVALSEITEKLTAIDRRLGARKSGS